MSPSKTLDQREKLLLSLLNVVNKNLELSYEALRISLCKDVEAGAPSTPESNVESAAIWLLKYLDRQGGLGTDTHRLIRDVLNGQYHVDELGSLLHIGGIKRVDVE